MMVRNQKHLILTYPALVKVLVFVLKVRVNVGVTVVPDPVGIEPDTSTA